MFRRATSFFSRTSLAENLDRSNIRANDVSIGLIVIGIGLLLKQVRQHWSVQIRWGMSQS
jgi:hypothetical protein